MTPIHVSEAEFKTWGDKGVKGVNSFLGKPTQKRVTHNGRKAMKRNIGRKLKKLGRLLW